MCRYRLLLEVVLKKMGIAALHTSQMDLEELLLLIRIKHELSQRNSVGGNSIFNMYGGSNSKDTLAMPRIPIPAVFKRHGDVTRGVEASTASTLSAEDLVGIISPQGATSPEPFETAALPASRSANRDLGPFATDYMSSPNGHSVNKKHIITLSTSMPRLANP